MRWRKLATPAATPRRQTWVKETNYGYFTVEGW